MINNDAIKTIKGIIESKIKNTGRVIEFDFKIIGFGEIRECQLSIPKGLLCNHEACPVIVDMEVQYTIYCSKDPLLIQRFESCEEALAELMKL